jgi:hypothetical protein
MAKPLTEAVLTHCVFNGLRLVDVNGTMQIMGTAKARDVLVWGAAWLAVVCLAATTPLGAARAADAASAPAWIEVSSDDGKRNWYIPEGWAPAEGVDEEVGDILIYRAPDGAAEYMVQGFSKSRGDSCPGVVEQATKNRKGKAQKGVYCGEGKDGDAVILACAREDKNGYIILLVLKAKPKLLQAMGGLAKIRELTRGTYGIAHSSS